MTRKAAFISADTDGVVPFARFLGNELSFKIFAHGPSVNRLADAGVGFTTVEIPDLKQKIQDRSSGLEILCGNCRDVQSRGRAFLSWKKEYASFDHETARAIRLAARFPDRLCLLNGASDLAKAFDHLHANEGRIGERFRVDQTVSALRAVSQFDFALSQYLETNAGDVPDLDALAGYPRGIQLSWERSQTIPSGENHSQRAALYGSFSEHLEQKSGPELDYRTIADLSLATFVIGEFEKPTAVVIRGSAIQAAASGNSLAGAIRKIARPSGFFSGGVVALNSDVGPEEIAWAESWQAGTLLAPSYDGGLRASGHLRLIASRAGLGYEALQELRSVVGGVLAQDRNRQSVNPFAWRSVGSVSPIVEEWQDMMFATKISRHLRSSCCVVVKDEAALALCEGAQAANVFEDFLSPNRFAGGLACFDDDVCSPEVLRWARRAGLQLILHPGVASEKEEQWRAAANELGVALIATGATFRRIVF